MKVLKFGGTSVGTAGSIKQVKEIVMQQHEDILVVVSALGGITDRILNAAKMASLGTDYFHSEYTEIIERHQNLINDLFADPAPVFEVVNPLMNELDQVLTGIALIGELTPKTLDRILGLGERLSSRIISKFLNDSPLIDSSMLILTDSGFGKATVRLDVTYQRIREKFKDFNGIAVAPGFIARNEAGEYTTLGRGGSDYTAALFAAATGADSLEIWTDVNGFMTADPRVINNAYTIPVLTYSEAMELSHFGAKVIYPPTILPVYQKGIPVLIKNTFEPIHVGTLIKSKEENGKDRPIKGISSISGIALVTIQGLGMVGVTGISMRLFKALAGQEINVILISQASSENSISVAIDDHSLGRAETAIRNEFEKEIQQDLISRVQLETELSIVAIVGENMKHTTGIAGKLFATLGKNGINVIAIAQGASELNISWVVKASVLKKTLNVVHESFFLSEFAELNVFLIGTGLVGKNLLGQLSQQHEKLLAKKHLRIRLTGLANTRRMAFNREGLSIPEYKNELDSNGLSSNLGEFVSKMKEMNLFNSVFVDCTASHQVSDWYAEILESNISVVAANKVAASSSYKNYLELKNIAKRKGVKFLFETNVGAGLPIINTLNDLVNSGDKILKIEAVLSGTLNFIFNTISEEITLSQAIRMAKEQGYAEPDPRIDLSGLDVARKLLILARESGYVLEMNDITINRFLPDSCFEGKPEEFWGKVEELDNEFEIRRKELESRGLKWRFVARFEENKAEVGLQEVNYTHPFSDLEGSNNLVMYTTERYQEFPMLIKGYGAGASVTAAGVFADLIRVSNI